MNNQQGKTSPAYVRRRGISKGYEGMSTFAPVPIPFDITQSPDLAEPIPVLLLTVTEVCTVLRCGRTFLYGLLQQGELRPVKLGRLTRISRVALDAFVARKASEAMCGQHGALASTGRAVPAHALGSKQPRRRATASSPTARPAPGSDRQAALELDVPQQI